MKNGMSFYVQKYVINKSFISGEKVSVAYKTPSIFSTKVDNNPKAFISCNIFPFRRKNVVQLGKI